MNCRLITLRLHNFKGIQDFTLETGGYNVAVFGDNAAGKTTLVDAFCWLLFGKDAAGRTDFEIKTLGSDGEAEHNLDHEVEAELLLDDNRRVRLQKTYREKWENKRGDAHKTFTGHTTKHHVDGVPVQKKEYDDVVAELADAGAFQLLTDPAYLAEQMHWQKRRELLLEICGDVSVEDVAATSAELADVPAILDGLTHEKRKAVLLARRTEINKTRAALPERIDEATRALPDVNEDEETLRKRLADLRAERSAVEERRAAITAGGATAELKARLKEIDAEVLGIKTRLATERQEAVRGIEEQLSAWRGAANTAKTAAERLQEDVAAKKREAERFAGQADERRARWHERNEETFEHSQDSTCSACGQALPEWKLKEARDRAEAQFNTAKSRDLQELQQEGKDLTARREKVEAAIPGLEEQLADYLAKHDAAKAEIALLEGELEAANARLPNLEDDAEYQKLAEEALSVRGDLTRIEDTVGNEREAARKELDELDKKIEAAEAMLSRISARASGLARIENLKESEQRLAAEMEDLERALHVLEQFTRAKCDLLTDRINGRFELARFKLFDVQINEGVRDCCEVMCPNDRGALVPWRNLNHGARVRVGLDIIRTLQEHFGIAPPVWVDQGESVTSLPRMDCQMIRLVVSEGDKALRVETTNEHVMEAA